MFNCSCSEMWILSHVNFMSCEFDVVECYIKWVFKINSMSYEYYYSLLLEYYQVNTIKCKIMSSKYYAMWILYHVDIVRCEYCAVWILCHLSIVTCEYFVMWILWHVNFLSCEYYVMWMLQNVNILSCEYYVMLG